MAYIHCLHFVPVAVCEQIHFIAWNEIHSQSELDPEYNSRYLKLCGPTLSEAVWSNVLRSAVYVAWSKDALGAA